MTVGEVFDRCRGERRAALIVYLMAGDPNLAITKSLLVAAAEGGADIIELGIPYSDPLADGPTIQSAAQRALKSGTTFDGVVGMMERSDRERLATPILAFTYYNPLFVRGLDKAAQDLAHAGFGGAIVPDLPPEEAGAAEAAFERAGIGLTLLIAPTTPIDRAKVIAAKSSGFVYVVSRMGVTGANRTLDDDVARLVGQVRTVSEKPIAVGFGVSGPEHARTIAAFADGVIVGSALIDRLAAAPCGREPDVVRDYCRMLADTLKK